MVGQRTTIFKPNEKVICLKVANVRLINAEDIDEGWEDYEHGYIPRVTKNSIYIRVDDSVLNLVIDSSNTDIEHLLGKKIHPPTYYINVTA